MSNSDLLKLTGGCHCQAVRFSAHTKNRVALACNCSICAALGYLHVIVPKEKFELLQGKESLTTYRFNTRTAEHTFCSRCGVKAFYRPRSHPNSVSINLRCVESPVAQDQFEIRDFNGKNWEDNIESIREKNSS